MLYDFQVLNAGREQMFHTSTKFVYQFMKNLLDVNLLKVNIENLPLPDVPMEEAPEVTLLRVEEAFKKAEAYLLTRDRGADALQGLPSTDSLLQMDIYEKGRRARAFYADAGPSKVVVPSVAGGGAEAAEAEASGAADGATAVDRQTPAVATAVAPAVTTADAADDASADATADAPADAPADATLPPYLLNFDAYPTLGAVLDDFQVLSSRNVTMFQRLSGLQRQILPTSLRMVIHFIESLLPTPCPNTMLMDAPMATEAGVEVLFKTAEAYLLTRVRGDNQLRQLHDSDWLKDMDLSAKGQHARNLYEASGVSAVVVPSAVVLREQVGHRKKTSTKDDLDTDFELLARLHGRRGGPEKLLAQEEVLADWHLRGPVLFESSAPPAMASLLGQAQQLRTGALSVDAPAATSASAVQSDGTGGDPDVPPVANVAAACVASAPVRKEKPLPRVTRGLLPREERQAITRDRIARGDPTVPPGVAQYFMLQDDPYVLESPRRPWPRVPVTTVQAKSDDAESSTQMASTRMASQDVSTKVNLLQDIRPGALPDNSAEAPVSVQDRLTASVYAANLSGPETTVYDRTQYHKTFPSELKDGYHFVESGGQVDRFRGVTASTLAALVWSDIQNAHILYSTCLLAGETNVRRSRKSSSNMPSFSTYTRQENVKTLPKVDPFSLAGCDWAVINGSTPPLQACALNVYVQRATPVRLRAWTVPYRLLFAAGSLSRDTVSEMR